MRSAVVAGLAFALAAGCAREPAHAPAESVVWVPGSPRQPLRGGFGPGAVCASADETWIAYEESTRAGGRIHVQIVGSDPEAPPRRAATFPGRRPGIAIDTAARPLVVYAMTLQDGGEGVVARSGDAAGRTWDEPVVVAREAGLDVVPGRLVHTRGSGWLLPVSTPTGPAAFTSRDGRTWSRLALRDWPVGAGAPAIIEAADGTWHGLVALADGVHASSSVNRGASWTGFAPLAAGARAIPARAFAVAPGRTGALLAWVESPPDTGAAPPGVWTLRLAALPAPRAALEQLVPVARRAGDAIRWPALAPAAGGSAIAWFAAGRMQAAAAACVLVSPAARPAATTTRSAIAALDLWAQHTLARPAPSQRLFIEGYCMRGLVAAHAFLGDRPVEGAWLRGADIERGVLQARSFTEWMLAGQSASGYWPLGYKAVYAADMAAVVGLYAAIAPHLDAGALSRATDSARRFAAALERDGMLHADGSCGVGWLETRDLDEAAALRAPYLVSTALAGIATHAWLYARTGEPEFARRARAALDYTLAALGPDGSLPPFAAGDVREGPHLAAAYVHEGWMAADRFLEDDAVRERLRRALPAHVGWLLRTQKPDGTWGETADGESARTIAIPNFLIWYDRRCEERADVREAVRRAGVALLDPDRWLDSGLLRAGKHEDVQRALAGRTLAALASGEPVY